MVSDLSDTSDTESTTGDAEVAAAYKAHARAKSLLLEDVELNSPPESSPLHVQDHAMEASTRACGSRESPGALAGLMSNMRLSPAASPHTCGTSPQPPSPRLAKSSSPLTRGDEAPRPVQTRTPPAPLNRSNSKMANW
jgi:anti-sigma factor RsiW